MNAGDGHPRRKGAEQSGRGRRRQKDEQAAILLSADQPAEGLGEPCPDNPVVIGAAAARRPPSRMKHRRPGPGHAFHHHQPERFSRNVDSVAKRIGAEERRPRIVAEDVDQGAGVDRIDMLSVEGQARPCQPVRDPGMDRPQPLDRREQAQRAAVGGLDEPGISAGQSGRIALPDVGDDQDFAVRGIIERAGRLEPGSGRGRWQAPVRASALDQSPPPRRVAEVTRIPCAGFSTVSASGRVGSSQRR